MSPAQLKMGTSAQLLDEQEKIINQLENHKIAWEKILEQRAIRGGAAATQNAMIADIATLGWVRNLIGFYGARELVAFDELTNVPAWLERGLERPAVQRGLTIPERV